MICSLNSAVERNNAVGKSIVVIAKPSYFPLAETA